MSAKKRNLRRKLAVLEAQAKYCPRCNAALARMRDPGSDRWNAVCTRFCGYRVGTNAPP